MKTYICPNYLKDSLLENLLKDQTGIFGIEIISVQQFLREIYPDSSLNTYDIYNLLKDLPLTDLKLSLNDVTFLNNALKDRYLVDMYQINVDDLMIHKDYKLILKTLPCLDKHLLDQTLQQDFSDYIIVEAYYPWFIQNQIIDKMLKHGAQSFKFTACANHHNYRVPTQNYRQSIDKIAGYIISQNIDIEDCAVVAAQDQFDLIKVNFKRFNIPVYTKQPSAKGSLGQKFVALVDFYLNQNSDDQAQRHYFNELITLNALNLSRNNSLGLRKFIFENLNEFKLETCHQFDGLTCDRDNRYYIQLQKTYNEVMSHYQPYFEELNALESFDEVILKVFDTLKDGSQETMRIKNIIEKYRGHLEDAYPFYRHELLDIKTKAEQSGLLLIGYNEEIYNKTNLFVLNPNIKNYPGFKGREGFLNEQVLESTNYPSIEKRYQHHAKAHAYLEKSANTFYLLPGSSIDGKANEFEETLLQYDVYNIAIPDNPTFVLNEHALDEQTAHAAFFEKNVLHGSISSFEKYFNCPYCYFLNYGLDLYIDRETKCDAAAAGTIVHKVFEKLVDKYHKEYYNATEEDIDEILNQYQERYTLVLPTQIELNDAMLKRIKQTVLNELIFIKSMELNTIYQPKETEYPFKETIVSDGIDEVVLKGVIDRVDEAGPLFRIIDYKTSDHDLKPADILQGLQLQLLTYALIYQKVTDKHPIGQFYLNVTKPKSKIDNFKYSKTGGVVEKLVTDEMISENFMKAHQLKGLVFALDENLDQDENHIKTGRKDARMIDLDLTRKYIKDIYLYLLKTIRSGEIPVRPVEGACQYCEYHSICHFKGLELKKLDQPIEGQLKKEAE